jgi:four helix bundle protein
MKKRFRFQDLTIWQDALQIAHTLAEIADNLEGRKLFRYAEQLRGAALSVSNNIAEGSGSSSQKDFANFLNFAKRSCFELANMTIFFSQRGYFPEENADRVLEALDHECRKIESFRKSLRAA